MFAKNAPKMLWPKAVAYACYIKNRSPTRALGMGSTPFQAFFGKKPDIAWLEEFGTNCWVMVPEQRRAKLDPKAEEHTFVGIAEHAKAWKYFNKVSKHVQTSRNITFDENNDKLFPIPDDDNTNDKAPLEGEQAPNEVLRERQPQPTAPTPDMSPDTTPTPDPSGQAPGPLIRRSARITQRPDYQKLNDPGRPDTAYVTYEIVTELENYRIAVSCDDAPIWEEAMQIEMDQHQEIGTWEKTELPPERTAIGCRWVYAVKTSPDGQFEKAKARIVAQGFTQRPGMDYYEITSPVVKFDSLRILLAIANALDWEIEMMDVKGAYLNSDLKEEIYMRQPDGFDDGTG